VKQLRAAGAEKVWRETASGAKTDRAQLRRVLDQLDAGDVLIANRLLRPASAAALPGLGAVANSLKRAFDEVDAQLTKWINHAQLAA
jgi:hypothetical protein